MKNEQKKIMGPRSKLLHHIRRYRDSGLHMKRMHMRYKHKTIRVSHYHVLSQNRTSTQSSSSSSSMDIPLSSSSSSSSSSGTRSSSNGMLLDSTKDTSSTNEPFQMDPKPGDDDSTDSVMTKENKTESSVSLHLLFSIPFELVPIVGVFLDHSSLKNIRSCSKRSTKWVNSIMTHYRCRHEDPLALYWMTCFFIGHRGKDMPVNQKYDKWCGVLDLLHAPRPIFCRSPKLSSSTSLLLPVSDPTSSSTSSSTSSTSSTSSSTSSTSSVRTITSMSLISSVSSIMHSSSLPYKTYDVPVWLRGKIYWIIGKDYESSLLGVSLPETVECFTMSANEKYASGMLELACYLRDCMGTEFALLWIYPASSSFLLSQFSNKDKLDWSKWMERAAMAGSGAAAWVLYDKYKKMRDDNIPGCVLLCRHWCERAAELGYTRAFHSLGLLEEADGNIVAAKTSYLRGAQNGGRGSMFNYAALCWNDGAETLDTEKKELKIQESVYWLTEAATRCKDRMSMCRLGDYYRYKAQRQSDFQSFTMARHWYASAARANCIHATKALNAPDWSTGTGYFSDECDCDP